MRITQTHSLTGLSIAVDLRVDIEFKTARNDTAAVMRFVQSDLQRAIAQVMDRTEFRAKDSFF
jgi:hypothetical protein